MKLFIFLMLLVLLTSCSSNKLTELEAKEIAESTCIKDGESLTEGTYNEVTKTWWFDANLNSVQEGCNPACVVSEETKTAEINYRCTGLIEKEIEQENCESSGYEWKVFGDGCVDSCEKARHINFLGMTPLVCEAVVKASCDCGPDKCWNGNSCEDN